MYVKRGHNVKLSAIIFFFIFWYIGQNPLFTLVLVRCDFSENFFFSVLYTRFISAICFFINNSPYIFLGKKEKNFGELIINHHLLFPGLFIFCGCRMIVVKNTTSTWYIHNGWLETKKGSFGIGLFLCCSLNFEKRMYRLSLVCACCCTPPSTKVTD